MIVHITETILNEQEQRPVSLPAVLRRMKIHFPLYCGGNGTCGKCLIQVKEGWLPVTAEDRRCLTEVQLEAGYRLGCQAVIDRPCLIELKENVVEQDFYVPLSWGSQKEQYMNRCARTLETRAEKSEGNGAVCVRYGIAIDIGTTTLAMVLMRLSDGCVIRQYTGLNHQRSYGTDVMARIRAAVENADTARQMQHLIRADLLRGICDLTETLSDGSVQIVAVAGNTTMIHLLRGYDCTGLGQYPFTPFRLSKENLSVKELLGTRNLPAAVRDGEVIVFPGISAFVGGDITAGLWACGFHKPEGVRLFLDLGTNGEMALRCGNQLIVTSAAAGPAFEGGHLSCGTGSVPGAIRNVRIQYGMVRYETIGRQAPKGLCGTGMVACMAEMLERHWMNTEGLLDSRYTANGLQVIPGKVWVNQRDVREFQKAKAAIRAGLEILMAEAGCEAADIESLELAGGFGCELDVKQAVRIGLIPAAMSEKVRQNGNTVIKGLCRYLLLPDEQGIAKLLDLVREISLADHPDFAGKYLASMEFPGK